MQNTPLRNWLLFALVACSAFLGSCTTVCIGPICVPVDSQLGVPLLYADAGVHIERPLKGELPYQPGIALQRGDVIQTTSGNAVIDFDDDNIVALRENTRIQLGSIRLFLGEVFARIGRIIQRGGGQVSTDELSASVRGTEYSVRRTPFPGRTELGNTSVIVRKGRVLCEDREVRWRAIELTENRVFRVEGKQLPRPPEYVNALAETAWADKVIERLWRPRGTFNIGITVPRGGGQGPTERGRHPPYD